MKLPSGEDLPNFAKFRPNIYSTFDQCSTYAETRQLVFTSKMFEKHLRQSDILSKDAGR